MGIVEISVHGGTADAILRVLPQPGTQSPVGQVQVLVGTPVLYRCAGAGGLDRDVGTILGHHHLGLHVRAVLVEVGIVVAHLDGARLLQAPPLRLAAQLVEQLVVLRYADGFADRKYLLLRVLHQDDMILIFHCCLSFHAEDVRLQSEKRRPLFRQLRLQTLPSLPEMGKELRVLQCQQRP